MSKLKSEWATKLPISESWMSGDKESDSWKKHEWTRFDSRISWMDIWDMNEQTNRKQKILENWSVEKWEQRIRNMKLLKQCKLQFYKWKNHKMYNFFLVNKTTKFLGKKILSKYWQILSEQNFKKYSKLFPSRTNLANWN